MKVHKNDATDKYLSICHFFDMLWRLNIAPTPVRYESGLIDALEKFYER